MKQQNQEEKDWEGYIIDIPWVRKDGLPAIYLEKKYAEHARKVYCMEEYPIKKVMIKIYE